MHFHARNLYDACIRSYAWFFGHSDPDLSNVNKLVLRNNFTVTKKFLITKFDCIMRKVWYNQILIQTYLGFIVLIQEQEYLNHIMQSNLLVLPQSSEFDTTSDCVYPNPKFLIFETKIRPHFFSEVRGCFFILCYHSRHLQQIH